ncbi:MAG: hypothetical protein OXH03_12180 [Bacteroidetes bacterium]|nr:hypothetical protein [Bacteroidota bacterium]MDE2672518.1 hypothetical protein [Bacteroidota bacterium]
MNKQNGADGPFTRATRLLRKTALTADQANQLVEILNEMTSIEAAKIVERLESKIDAQNTKYSVLIWAIGFAGVVISAAIFFGR